MRRLQSQARPSLEQLEGRVTPSTFSLQDYDITTMRFEAPGTVPAARQIPCDGLTDVTAYLNDAIQDTGSGNTLVFANKAYTWGAGQTNYRVRGTIEVNGLDNVTITGNGVKLQWYGGDNDNNGDTDNRPHVQVVGATTHHILITNVHVKGSGPDKGQYQAITEGEHGFSVRSSAYNVSLVGCQAYNVYGDGLNVGLPWNAPPHDVVALWCRFEDTGRQGVAFTSGYNLVLAGSYVDDAGRTLIDIEPWGSTTNPRYESVTNIQLTQNLFGSCRFNQIAIGGGGHADSISIANNTFFEAPGLSTLWVNATASGHIRSGVVFVNNAVNATNPNNTYGSGRGHFQFNGTEGAVFAGNNINVPTQSDDPIIFTSRTTNGLVITDNYVHNGTSTTTVPNRLINGTAARMWVGNNVMQYTAGWASSTRATALTTASGATVGYHFSTPWDRPETPGGSIQAILRVRTDAGELRHSLIRTTDILSLAKLRSNGSVFDGWTTGEGAGYAGWFGVALQEL